MWEFMVKWMLLLFITTIICAFIGLKISALICRVIELNRIYKNEREEYDRN